MAAFGWEAEISKGSGSRGGYGATNGRAAALSLRSAYHMVDIYMGPRSEAKSSSADVWSASPESHQTAIAFRGCAQWLRSEATAAL